MSFIRKFFQKIGVLPDNLALNYVKKRALRDEAKRRKGLKKTVLFVQDKLKEWTKH